MGRKPPRFHCKSEAQKNTIAGKCTRRAEQQKAQQQAAQRPRSRVKKTVSDTANKITQAKPSFRLPLQNGGHCWNIYKVSNKILNGKQDNDVHGGLVLAEENDNVILVEVTHSPKNGKRNNVEIPNLTSTDIDKTDNSEKPKLRKSHMKRKLVVSIVTQNGVEGIDVSALKQQMNDLHFTAEEKQHILDELSHLDSAEGQYILFKDLAAKKNTDK